MAFRFQQFFINDDRCAMRVGTDGVLLGVWVESTIPAMRILDVGTGSGLVALMAAQRFPEAEVVGVEIDPEAAAQAQVNAQASPFATRVRMVSGDIRAFSAQPFDLILANPPFHEETLCPPNAARAMARNTSALTFGALVEHCTRLLSRDGSMAVIVPWIAVSRFIGLCGERDLYLSRRTDVLTSAKKPPRRALLQFRRTPVPPVVQTLLLHTDNGRRTPEYAALTQAFYL